MSNVTSKRVGRFLALSVGCLLLVSCTEITVQNNSTEKRAVARITMPDSTKPQVATLKPGQSIGKILDNGGRFSVSVVSEEDTKVFTKHLADAGAAFTVGEGHKLQEALAEWKKAENEVFGRGSSCGGNIPENGSAVVQISWDSQSAKWQVVCAVHKPEATSSEP